MTLKNLTELFQDQIQDLHSAETQLVDALPKMAESAHCNNLKGAFQSHLAETKAQLQRLERIAKDLDFKVSGKTCSAMKGLVAEGSSAIDESAPSSVHDANLVAAAQRVEHYEMSGYGTAREFAQVLGHLEAARLLQESLNEEREADRKLTSLCRALFDKAPKDAVDTENAPAKIKEDENRDPITGEHGAHPVGAGVGAATGGIAAGAATGAAIGMVAGPVGVIAGAAAGAAVGAVVGGLAGKAVAESVNPTVEHNYWQAQFRNLRYISPSDAYETYAPAYQYGWESGACSKGKKFSEVEQELGTGWNNARGTSTLDWDRAKNAARDSWERAAKK